MPSPASPVADGQEPPDPSPADPAAPPVEVVAGDEALEDVPDAVVDDSDHPRRDLKAEAVSLKHKLTHTPFNKYCPVCRVAKAQRRPCRRRHIPTIKAVNFGDLVTADHVVAHSERSMGVTRDRNAVIIGDKATGYIEGIPVKTKGRQDTIHAMLQFAGARKPRYLWTDGSGELSSAANFLRIPHGIATPARPQTNGAAERLVRSVMEGSRSLLVEAGLPPSFWPFAMRHYCFLKNIDVVDGDSAWNKRHRKGHFTGPVYHFGQQVSFMPVAFKTDHLPKAAPKMIPGVILGYKLNPGG